MSFSPYGYYMCLLSISHIVLSYFLKKVCLKIIYIYFNVEPLTLHGAPVFVRGHAFNNVKPTLYDGI